MTYIYLVVLVDMQGERTPLLACLDEAIASAVVEKMGGMGEVERVPLLDGSAD